ncbi:MAG: DUF5722 domain-containing protein [Bacteroidales bacterium]|nr:DUF5722 domain-containing protein [Bacteroidales bacterium]
MKRISKYILAVAVVALSASVCASAQVLTMEEREAVAANIDNYLSSDFQSVVKSVKVTSDKVIIKGKCAKWGKYLLADITPWQDITELETFPYSKKLRFKWFKTKMDRMALDREGIDYDRVFSKWAIVKVDGGNQTLDSYARYADEVAPKASPEALPLKTKKGFAAGSGDMYIQEIKDLGIASITQNIWLDRVISGEEGSDFTYGGKNFKVGKGADGMEKVLTSIQDQGVVVSAILLCPNESVYRDPENAGGFYTMPNLTSAEAFNVYAAVIEYLAERYTSGEHGRISHWIMHNEVDMGHEWTNMGEQPEARFFDRLMKSTRIVYNIVRQYDQNASVLHSFTHNWVNGDKPGFAPKSFLDRTLDYCAKEGDFRWGVAYHPYPQDLSKPKFWIDDVERSTFSRNSDYITFYNLEVLNDWILQPEHFYQGAKRVLFLSEQGTNSPSYSEEDMALQAAGGAWAWKKVAALEGIDAMQWHGWADGKWEFGLRIGLHTFDEGDVPALQRKPVWYMWEAAGTENEDAVFDQYLPVIGIDSWDQIFHEVTE